MRPDSVRDTDAPNQQDGQANQGQKQAEPVDEAGYTGGGVFCGTDTPAGIRESITHAVEPLLPVNAVIQPDTIIVADQAAGLDEAG